MERPSEKYGIVGKIEHDEQHNGFFANFTANSTIYIKPVRPVPRAGISLRFQIFQYGQQGTHMPMLAFAACATSSKHLGKY